MRPRECECVCAWRHLHSLPIALCQHTPPREPMGKPASVDLSVSFAPPDVLHLLAYALMWEVVWQIGGIFAHLLFQHPKITKFGMSYTTAFINALLCSIGGTWCAISLLADSYAARAVVDVASPSMYWPYLAPGVFIYQGCAHCFLGWLMMDIVHTLLHFPKLGGMDTILHHVSFMCLTALGSSYSIFPFVVSWLLLGEISSLPLNIRWLLINSGRGDSQALTATNAVFAISFFVVRVVIFWAGLAHLLLYLRPTLLDAPYNCPTFAVYGVCFFVTLGGCLNAFWMVSIIKMAFRGGKKPKEKHAFE